MLARNTETISAYGSVYTAMEVILSFLHVAIILQAISPRFAINSRRIRGTPSGVRGWCGAKRGGLDEEEDIVKYHIRGQIWLYFARLRVCRFTDWPSVP